MKFKKYDYKFISTFSTKNLFFFSHFFIHFTGVISFKHFKMNFEN